MQEKLQALLDDYDLPQARRLNLVLQAVIVASLLVISLETLPDLSPRARVVLYWADVAIVGVFTAEYLARIYAAPKKLGFIFSFWGLVDLLAILPIYLLIFGIDYNLLVLRTLRLMKLARIVRFVRFNKSFRRLSLALDIAKQDLILAVLATCLIQFIASVGIYQFENPVQPEKFSSVFASLWWALATLTTVGYGDIYPITLGGKIFTGLILMTGLGVVALPAGIFASALTEAKEREKKGAKRSLVVCCFF